MAVALRLLIVAGIAISAGSRFPVQAQPPGLVAKAKTNFEAVDRAPRPALKDILACEQSQAALLPAARPEVRYLVHYRKAYCELFGAALWDDAPRFQLAAHGFAEAIANWPRKAAARIPSGLRAFMYIARLENGRMADSYPDMERDLKLVVAAPSCVAT
ncbi:MAG: hypothetical protein ABIZ80_21515, partial [Bryobacteraceae bacterium]